MRDVLDRIYTAPVLPANHRMSNALASAYAGIEQLNLFLLNPDEDDYFSGNPQMPHSSSADLGLLEQLHIMIAEGKLSQAFLDESVSQLKELCSHAGIDDEWIDNLSVLVVSVNTNASVQVILAPSSVVA